MQKLTREQALTQFNFKPKHTSQHMMANGLRKPPTHILDEEEINFVIEQATIIKVDISILVFNSELVYGTSYDDVRDIVNIKGNVFPDTDSYSTHPRDLLSVKAVIAHEYYGHRPHREEYLSDRRDDTITTPYWLDECRASLEAAQITPNLTDNDRLLLVQDALVRAYEAGQEIEHNEFITEVLYGYNHEKGICPTIEPIRYHSRKGNQPKNEFGDSIRKMPPM